LAGWIVLGACARLQAATTTQTLSLNYGWNAIWLMVAPEDQNGSPLKAEEVFQSPNFIVDKVAKLNSSGSKAQFTTDPSQPLQTSEWDIWSKDATSGENAPINLRGHRAYLLHVIPASGTAVDGALAGSLMVAGRAAYMPLSWKKGSYNLVGFGIQGSPTFGDLLSGSRITVKTTGSEPTILRMDSATGIWVPVPATATVISGQAYWVLAPFDLVGMTDLGPVSLSFDGEGSGEMNFGTG
jgi:hypothetical protein